MESLVLGMGYPLWIIHWGDPEVVKTTLAIAIIFDYVPGLAGNIALLCLWNTEKSSWSLSENFFLIS